MDGVYGPRKLQGPELDAVDWATLLKPLAELDTLLVVGAGITGHIVVEMAIVKVVTVVESAGQLVKVAAQLVTVISLTV